MPQDRAGAVVLDPSFFAAPQMPGLQSGTAAGRQAGQQASSDAFDFAYPTEGLDTEAGLMDEYVKGVQGLQQMFETGMAKGLNPARPDLNNPDSVALSRAFRDRYAESFQLAEALKTSRDAREKMAELRLREGIAGATQDTGSLLGFRDMERELIQTRPFDDIVTEFNKISSEFQTRGAQGQFDRHRAQAEAAIDELARQRINQGDNPREVEIARDAAKAKLRRSIYDPPVFAPSGGGSGSDRAAKVAGRRALLNEMAGVNGPQQATAALQGLAGQTVEWQGQQYAVSSASYHIHNGQRSARIQAMPIGLSEEEKFRLKTIEEVIADQGLRDKRRLLGGTVTAEQQAQDWLDKRVKEQAPEAWTEIGPTEIEITLPDTDNESDLMRSSGYAQLTGLINSSVPDASDRYGVDEIRMTQTPTGVGLPSSFPQPGNPQPDKNGVIVGVQPTGKVKTTFTGVRYPAGTGPVGTLYEMDGGKYFFVPQ